MLIRLLQSRQYWLLPLLFWGFVVALSLTWNLERLSREIRGMALERGRIMFEMVRQTKINPLLMQNDPAIFKRQVVEEIEFRVVSANPRNPENRADDWESRALQGFDDPQDFLFERQDQQGEPHFRYIGPVFMQQNCLPCHGYESRKVGDLRGGISVNVNARHIYETHAGSRDWILLTHLGSLLLLAGSSIFLLSQLRRHWLLLTETRDRLKRQEGFLSSITRAMGEGCVVVDRDGVVTFVNPEAEWLLGRGADEIIGRPWLELVMPPSAGGRGNGKSPLRQTLRDGMLRREESESLLHKDGLLVPVAYSVSAMDDGTDINGAVLTFNDISERKRAEAERSRMERELNQAHKLEAVGQLAGGIAHEINTPIQYVGENLRFLQEACRDIVSLCEAYTELMREAESKQQLSSLVERIKTIMEGIEYEYLLDEAPKAIEQSMEGTEQVTRIVQAMKEFAHPGSRKIERADLNKIIRNTVTVCRNEWKYVADIELQLDPELPHVECLGSEISQVLLNLIVNAAHAIEAAKLEDKGRITISNSWHEDTLEVRVADNGTGIPEAVRESVFNPFFTTKEVGRGTGQGLAIAQDIVAVKHRGRLFFETQDGVGSTFIMQLPLRQDGVEHKVAN
jgi:PAS domain S-box-containing protein